MKAQEKDYIISRIKNIKARTMPECECPEPDIGKFIRQAIVRGEAKLKPLKTISGAAKELVLQADRYSGDVLRFEQVFREPSDYKVALAAHQDSERAIEAARENRSKKFQELIDRVNLNEFENGNDAIKEAELI